MYGPPSATMLAAMPDEELVRRLIDASGGECDQRDLRAVLRAEVLRRLKVRLGPRRTK